MYGSLYLTILLVGCTTQPFNSSGGWDSSSGDGVSSNDYNSANEKCGIGNCQAEGSPTMLPGSDCLVCHNGSGGGGGGGDEGDDDSYYYFMDDDAPAFSVAGTVYTDLDGHTPASGAVVQVEDASATVVSMTANSAGNFYTTRAVQAPFIATVDVDGAQIEMMSDASTGACSSCHQCGGSPGGKLYAL